jgi:molybdopterin synthase catalytic subunit
MFEITEKPISPEKVISKVKTGGSGCLVTYIGLIRNISQGKQVRSVEYKDIKGNASEILKKLANEAAQKWKTEKIAITHRVGILKVGEINLVVAVAGAHRKEGFAASRYIINEFKKRRPTTKVETYSNGSVLKGIIH